MSEFVERPLGDFFTAENGKPKYIKDFLDANPGPHPVYSASLIKPFGHTSDYDYDGEYLTWVMNGYGGRTQVVSGRFSASRDRGVFIPKPEVVVPDLTYLRFAAEPQLVEAAVGRRVDGRLNEYTKLYRDDALAVSIRLPVSKSGKLDFKKMANIGEQFRRLEKAKAAVVESHRLLTDARYSVNIEDPSQTFSLGDTEFFNLSIGKRVLRSEHVAAGIPAYSANVQNPFGNVAASNLSDFSAPSILWGIDGNFDWAYIEKDLEFATTDHCGRLQVQNSQLDPMFVFWYLKLTKERYGFDRVYRAKLENIRTDVEVMIPLDSAGKPSLTRQKAFVAEYAKHEQIRLAALAALDDVKKARLSVEG